jgi:putative flippase GtrA
VIRLLKFSFVGAVGIIVQLAVLTLLVRWKANYLLATALAVESAVLHNFVWHERFTWAERNGGERVVRRLLRFHLSNGVVSIAGNLILMRLLVGKLGLPILVSNVVSVAACFVVNYLVSDRWVFVARDSGLIRAVSHQHQRPLREWNVNEGCGRS